MRLKHIVSIVVGLLLILFGGGCAILAGYALIQIRPWSDPDPAAQGITFTLIAGMLLGGLLPLAIGCILIWTGVKRVKSLDEVKPNEATKAEP